MASVYKRISDQADARKKKAAKWYISWFDHERGTWRNCVGYTDKESSLAKGVRLEKESADRHEGIEDSVRASSLKPIEEHLAAYVTHLRAKGRDDGYILQLERRLTRLFAEIKATRLVDVDADSLETAILGMCCIRGFEKTSRLISHTTRNEYATSAKGFSAWAFKRRKIGFDPLAGLAKHDEKSVQAVHPRRAITPEEVGKLLDAALRRPEVDALTVRRGADKGKLLAKVRTSILEKRRKTGRHRRMAYLLAIWTGLRRAELAALLWTDVHLDAQIPFIQLRGEATKSRRSDVIPLHPQMVEELRTYRDVDSDHSPSVLPDVPDMDVFRKDLVFAGIEYGNQEIGFADLHAQRKTLNMLMATHGVDRRVRQAHLRHTDPRLTEDTYFDSSLFLKPHADELGLVPALPVLNVASNAVGQKSIDVEDKVAELMQKASGSEGQLGASPVILSESEIVNEVPKVDDSGGLQVTQLAQVGIKRQGPASCDTGPLIEAGEGGRTLDIHVGNVTLYH